MNVFLQIKDIIEIDHDSYYVYFLITWTTLLGIINQIFLIYLVTLRFRNLLQSVFNPLILVYKTFCIQLLKTKLD